MSHFTVLVIGEDPDKQLAPFHEYECTGREDQYVIQIDVTDKKRADYEEATRDYVFDSEGNFVAYWYNDRFYREASIEEIQRIKSHDTIDLDYRTKGFGDNKVYYIHELPNDMELREDVPISEYMTFLEYICRYGEENILVQGKDEIPDKGYYILVDSEEKEIIRIVDYTNPNAKWDWYTMGGRWSGFFLLKPEANQGDTTLGVNVTGSHPSGNIAAGPLEREGRRADQARKKDIDFETMRLEYVEKEVARFREWTDIVNGRPIPNWKAIIELHGKSGIDAARAEYNNDPVIVDLREAGFWTDHDEFVDKTEEDVATQAYKEAIGTFAVIKDGNWYERGKMGWWATVSDEMKEDQWLEKFGELLDSVDDETLLTLIDCHI